MEQSIADAVFKDHVALSTSQPQRREGLSCEVYSNQQFLEAKGGRAAIIEPTFYDFRSATDHELGFPFMAISNGASKFMRMSVFITYTGDNARYYKGYILDLKTELTKHYKSFECKTVPWVTCGVPMAGTSLVLIGKHEGDPWVPDQQTMPLMPSQYIPGLLAHVLRNRPDYPINVPSRYIGAVRSDLNLLPPVNQWAGKSLMCEYKKDKTTEIRRMKNEHVGMLFGTSPSQYTDDLMLCLPKDVIENFAS